MTTGLAASKPLTGLFFASIVVLTAACGSDNRDLLASTNAGVVTRTDLDRYILELPEEARRPAQGQDTTQWRLDHLRRFLADRALEPDADELDRLRNGAAAIEFEIAHDQIVLAAAVETYVTPRATISDEDLRRYYDAHPDEFGHPEQIRLRHIFRQAATDASREQREASRTEMEQLLERLREGAHFGDLAREYSDSETAQLQGLIGRLSRGQLDPSIEEIVWRMNPGEISDVVATPVGFHIFMLEDHLEPFTMDFEEARGRLLRRLTRLAREEAMQELESELLSESNAVYRPETLQAGRPAAEEVLFALGDHEITGADLESYRRSAGLVELRELRPAKWLEQNCRNRLLVWKAETDGIDTTPEVVEQIETAERNLVIAREFNQRINEKIKALEDAGVLEEYFDENILRFQTPKVHHLRLISIDFDRFERPYDALQLLDSIARECRDGTRDFAEAARQVSDDLSAPDGGDLGRVNLSRFVEWAGPRSGAAVIELEAGAISEPFITETYVERQLKYQRTGFAVVKIEEIKEPEFRPYTEVRQQVIERYLKRHRPELEEQVTDDLLESIDAEIFEDRL